METNAPLIPIGLIDAVLTTAHAAGLMSGRETHVPALHLVGESCPYTECPMDQGDRGWLPPNRLLRRHAR